MLSRKNSLILCRQLIMGMTCWVWHFLHIIVLHYATTGHLVGEDGSLIHSLKKEDWTSKSMWTSFPSSFYCLQPKVKKVGAIYFSWWMNLQKISICGLLSSVSCDNMQKQIDVNTSRYIVHGRWMPCIDQIVPCLLLWLAQLLLS